MDAAEYKHLVLGLIFVKYISDTFSAHRAALAKRLVNPQDEYYLRDATPQQIAKELEERDYYVEANIYWVPEPARWEALRAAAKQPTIGKHIDDALTLIEAENSKPKASWTNATPAPSYPTASWASWSIWCPPSALATTPM
jgi:type I restriction enzyme M protein